MTSSKEQLVLARRIAGEALIDRPYTKAAVIAGDLDETPIVQTALTAIIETTELAASWINCTHGLPTHDYEPGFNEVTGLRAFAHLKGPTHDEQ